ncbi:S1 RNA-binding domain-containing protein [Dictyoglomus thermophilum]|uniref:S1 RNA-binding domain-containing protein n=1 Tax=Dictyoglomus thermophilum TaxID=14 RepID=A0A7V3ZIA9_DICTH|nr:S1 RNA-binding domain-containing protein [Dictyoglomus thermophilum]TYT22568.1 S1 RNA-binding domain-containing protein [Dictyoglomus thermophilum]
MEELSDIKLEETDLSISIDTLVYGNILNITKDGLWLDIGKKYDAFLPYNELSKELKAKLEKKQEIDSIPVVIKHVNYKDGVITVSNKKAVENKIWEELLWAYENNQPIQGKVINYNGRGFILEINNEVEGFIPAKEIDVPPIKPPKYYINRRIEGKIKRINPEKNQLIISARELLEQKQEEERSNLWEKIKNSQIVRGRIIKVDEDKLTIDLGLGIIGIVEKDEISWFPIKNIRRYYNTGDIIKAKVLSLDENSRTAQLSIKQAQPNPWSLFKEKYPEGSIINAEIIKISGGIVVKVDNLIGYVPMSEISWGRPQDVKNSLKVGDKVKAKVLSVDDLNQKIFLSIKQVEPNPWEVIDQNYKIGEIVSGKVTNITDFRIFIEIKPGLEGLIPRKLISWERISNISDIFKPGDFIEAKIIDIDKENKKLTLSRRDLLKDPWEDIDEKYREGQNIKGRIIEKLKDGYIVELEPGIEGFLPYTQINFEKENEIQEFKENEEVEAKIVKINPRFRRITLSIKALIKEKLDQEMKKYLSEYAPPPLTLGELLKLKNNE